ncbi:MAG: alanine racemase [Proteobacteria bacterium]|nr:MAG: alanine racemase [Pseudomonadota bacterium]
MSIGLADDRRGLGLTAQHLRRVDTPWGVYQTRDESFAVTLTTPNPSSPHAIRPTVARIELSALTENYRALRQALSRPHRDGAARQEVAIIAVVKADAYGHGAVPVARALEGLGIWGFGVATVEEGAELRGAGVRAPILIMGAAFGNDHAEVLAHDLTPVVGDPGDVDRFATAAKAADRLRFSIHVKVDTGMNRLGVVEARFDEFIRRCARHPFIRVDGLETHFSCAEDPDPAPTEAQLQAFIRCLDHARAVGADPQLIHACNTAAALRFSQAHFDAVRLGIGLYGALPSAHVPDPGLTPALSLRTRINALREVPAGTPVSYGATYHTRRASIIATLPVGYADGYARRLGATDADADAGRPRAQVLIRGRRAPVVGRVCMDLCMVDVTDTPDVAVGDEVALLGGASRGAGQGPREGQSEAPVRAEELAVWGETIAYEVLTSISKRVPRVYPGVQASELAIVAAGGAQ